MKQESPKSAWRRGFLTGLAAASYYANASSSSTIRKLKPPPYVPLVAKRKSDPEGEQR